MITKLKTFIVGLANVCLANLFPYSECVITATTINQAKKMVKEKIEGELIKKLSPVLQYYYEQGLIKISYGDDEIRVDFLYNGSKIIVLPSADSSRGARATVLNYEECRLLKKGIVDSVFESMGRPRQAKFLTNEKYANDKRWLEQAKSIYITSNRFKSEWFFKTFRNTVEGCYLDKKIRYNFFGADIYLAIFHGIKSEGDLIKAKKTMSDIDFRAEVLNETIGESENSFFSLEMFRKNQIIKNAFYPPTENEIILDKKFKRNKKPNEYRFMWCDFSWSNSTGKTENDNTIIGLTSAIWNGEKMIRNNVYLETFESSDFDGLDLRIRELFYDFDVDYIVIDLRSGGEIIYNQLTSEREHPYRDSTNWNKHGLMICPDRDLNTVSDSKIEDLSNRAIDTSAREVIIPITATAELNSNIWKEMAKCLQNSTARFLIDDTDFRAILEEDKDYFTMTSEEKTVKMMPYVQTLLLINEAINLDTTYLNGNIKLSEHGNGFKDRIVAASYGNYIISKLENKLNKENQEEDFDISNWNIIF